MNLIEKLKKQYDMSIIWITHDLGLLAGLADRIIVMKNFMIKGEKMNNHNYKSMSSSIMEFIHD